MSASPIKYLLQLSFLICISLTLVSADYDPKLGATFASASALTECSPSSIMAWKCGAPCKNLTGYQPFFAEVFTISVNETLESAMILNLAEQRFVTIFRGTSGSHQMLLEFEESFPVPYDLSHVPGAEVLDYFYSRYINILRSTITEKLQMAYAAYPNFQFVFTGHSLGAALTTHAIFDAINQGIIPKEQTILYNYGSPRVGNWIFTQAVQALVPEIHRVVHWQDLVPHLPPCHLTSSNLCQPKNVTEVETIGGLNYWPAWHLAREVFYAKNGIDYVVCDGTGEDPACSDQFSYFETNTTDHDTYVNIYMGCRSQEDDEEPTHSSFANLLRFGI